MPLLLDEVHYDADGLVPAIAQDAATGEVLMLAYMNARALRQTFETGIMTYWSRSRQALWVKGQTSGHVQEVEEVRLDCDGDALLFAVKQHGGGACHTGHRSCFYRAAQEGVLIEAEERAFDPEAVYGNEN